MMAMIFAVCWTQTIKNALTDTHDETCVLIWNAAAYDVRII
jgi:hypothetical protein